MFFTKETHSTSRTVGNKNKKSKNGAGPQPIKSVIIQACIGNFILCYVKTKQDTVPELIG